MVSVKKSTIFSSSFFNELSVEEVLSYGLEREEAFEDDENVNFLNSKKLMGICQRGYSMVLVKKFTIFSSLFLQQNRPRNNVKLWSGKERSF